MKDKNELKGKPIYPAIHKRRAFRTYLNSPFLDYKPFYDDRADFNTNAKSYYDYLARFNWALNEIADFINRLIDRNIEVIDTTTIDFSKIGDWIDNGGCEGEHWDDIIKLKADVIFSKLTEVKTLLHTENKSFTVPNGSKDKTGVWSPDYMELISELDKSIGLLQNEITNIKKRLDKIEKDISDIKNELEEIQQSISNILNDLKDINQKISNLTNRVNSLETALKKIIKNLYDSGAITSNDFNFSFNSGRNIATGNINHFGGTQDGSSFIRTNKGSTENDTTLGI